MVPLLLIPAVLPLVAVNSKLNNPFPHPLPQVINPEDCLMRHRDPVHDKLKGSQRRNAGGDGGEGSDTHGGDSDKEN